MGLNINVPAPSRHSATTTGTAAGCSAATVRARTHHQRVKGFARPRGRLASQLGSRPDSEWLEAAETARSPPKSPCFALPWSV